MDYFEDTPDDVWDENKLLEGIQKANIVSLIKNLPSKYKEVLILHYYQDLKVEEISHIQVSLQVL
ncbi:RNA polymerase sigma factor [Lutispora thermophila]|uniref:Sigma-70, region 4 n=1 Tax=Lutispora thermophila DSM 19022 TaxID=1122184 RepID=A0A1M6BAM6_9FIRM|nr:sigma factor-like helix-turn-helix DNA-binding protein [Lutispora thermophila]SHI45717.1 Sigma-70, region 4 [Lutispora thermophila DSM 19022]